MKKEKSLTDKNYLLEKFSGKGGWTFVKIPEIPSDKSAHFGWVRVKGTIDDYEIKAYHLMPMGNGQLFLPVKADIRKKIKKKDGDYVHVILYKDDIPTEIPDELKFCLQDEPRLYKTFLGFNDSEKKAYIDWIYASKKEETRVERIAKMIQRLEKGLRFYDLDK